MNQPLPHHLDALTGVRGIAAWAVVLYHIRLTLTDLVPAPVIGVLAKGYLAVDLFFVLSGFVIWYNYAARIRSGGRAEVRRFLWRRFARVWPLHGAILVAFCALVLLLKVTGRATTGYPLAELPLQFALLQNWGWTAELTWNHPAWSISTEMAAYLLFPAIVCAVHWDRLPGWFLLLAAALIAAALHLLYQGLGYSGMGADLTRLGLWRCLAGFAMGNILCIVWLRWHDRSGMAIKAAAAFAGIVAAGMALGLAETAIVPAAFFTGLAALACDRGPVARLLGSRALTYLGEISYATYMAHFLLFILFKLAFVDASLQLGWMQFTGFLMIVLVVSIVLYHGFEKPAQRWLNRRAPRWIDPPVPVAAG